MELEIRHATLGVDVQRRVIVDSVGDESVEGDVAGRDVAGVVRRQSARWRDRLGEQRMRLDEL